MMNSMNDGNEEFGANPFRSDDGGYVDVFAPDPSQQQMQQPPVQQQQQFQQQPPPIQQQQFQPQQQQQFPPVNPNMPAGLMAPLPQQQQQPDMAAQQAPTSWWGKCMMCFTVDAYKVYFDIDADDIVKRIRGVFLHFYKPEYFRNNVMGAMKTDELKGPDLYGPFWITMTLIFFIGVTANMHNFVHRNDVDEFDYDINHLLHAASILISFAFVLPTILWITTKCCMGMQALQLVEWICLYGYSLVPYMPAVFLSTIPFGIVAWVTLGLATAASCLMVIRNVSPALLSSDTSGTGLGGQAKGPPTILIMLGCHIIFFLMLKYTFYHYIPATHTPSPTTAPTTALTAAITTATTTAPSSQ
mmetsp:Transcript_59230/g.68141  ORF Transcript_59230/g.68141 Transcript_59230/m.68141 type:complete len:358 (+) Transcript_59230:153-1226(+)